MLTQYSVDDTEDNTMSNVQMWILFFFNQHLVYYHFYKNAPDVSLWSNNAQISIFWVKYLRIEMLTKLVQEVQTLLSSHLRGTSLPGAPTPHYEGRHSQHEGATPHQKGKAVISL